LTGENTNRKRQRKGPPSAVQAKRAQTPHVCPLHPLNVNRGCVLEEALSVDLIPSL